VAISGTVAALLLSSACIAMSDVVADGIVVTRTRQAANQNNSQAVAGGLQSLCWGAAATGGLLSAYFSGSLLTVMSTRDVFGITAFLPLLVAIIALQMNEEPVTKTLQEEEDSDSSSSLVEGVQKQVSALWDAFSQPSIWRPSLFIFLWQSTPTADGAFFFFLSNDLGLGPEFMGRVRLVSSLATLVGVWLYNQYFKRVAIKDILFWSTLASFPLGLLPVLLITHANRAIGIPDQALIYGDDVVLAALGEIAFLPTLVLAARLCPPGIEAVLFATLMSIFNFASTVGTEIGAALTKAFGISENNFDNLALLTVLCNLTSLYPLLFIGWLDKVGDVSEEEIEATEGTNGVIDVEAHGSSNTEILP
jgi:folate/biopterin transporter